MDVLKITDSKLKIMLSADDMKKYRLSQATVDYNDPKTRKSFFEILNHVKQSHGFNVERDKVLIQFYPSKDGGSELFVTKLGTIAASSERALSKSSGVAMLDPRSSLYSFESLDDLIRTAKILKAADIHKSSDVYLGDDGEFYLELCERIGERGTKASSIISEFGRRMTSHYFAYVAEHARKLTSSDGIERLCLL
jgi:negative regulator of genetic competence, sporulation and motility